MGRCCCVLAFVVALLVPLSAEADPCSDFSDVASNDAFCNHVEWIKNRGVTLGCATNAYCPNASVSRLQMAAFLSRLGSNFTPWVQEATESAQGVDPELRPVLCVALPNEPRQYSTYIAVDAIVGVTSQDESASDAHLVARLGGADDWVPLKGGRLPLSARLGLVGNHKVFGDIVVPGGTSVSLGIQLIPRDSGSSQLIDVTCRLQARSFAANTQISRVLPASGPSGSAVIVEGTGFRADSNVMFDDQPAALQFVSSSKLLVAVPSGASGQPLSSKLVRLRVDGVEGPTFQVETLAENPHSPGLVFDQVFGRLDAALDLAQPRVSTLLDGMVATSPSAEVAAFWASTKAQLSSAVLLRKLLVQELRASLSHEELGVLERLLLPALALTLQSTADTPTSLTVSDGRLPGDVWLDERQAIVQSRNYITMVSWALQAACLFFSQGTGATVCLGLNAALVAYAVALSPTLARAGTVRDLELLSDQGTQFVSMPVSRPESRVDAWIHTSVDSAFKTAIKEAGQLLLLAKGPLQRVVDAGALPAAVVAEAGAILRYLDEKLTQGILDKILDQIDTSEKANPRMKVSFGRLSVGGGGSAVHFCPSYASMVGYPVSIVGEQGVYRRRGLRGGQGWCNVSIRASLGTIDETFGSGLRGLAFDYPDAVEVSLSVFGPGKIDRESGVPCTAPRPDCAAYDAARSLTLLATPMEGASLEEWGGACAGAGESYCLLDLPSSTRGTSKWTDPTEIDASARFVDGAYRYSGPFSASGDFYCAFPHPPGSQAVITYAGTLEVRLTPTHARLEQINGTRTFAGCANTVQEWAWEWDLARTGDMLTASYVGLVDSWNYELYLSSDRTRITGTYRAIFHWPDGSHGQVVMPLNLNRVTTP